MSMKGVELDVMDIDYLGNGLFEQALTRHFHSAFGSAGTTNLMTIQTAS